MYGFEDDWLNIKGDNPEFIYSIVDKKKDDKSGEEPAEEPAAPEEDPAEDPTDPELKEKAKALKKAMSEFIKTELENGDLDKFVQYCAEFGKSYVNKLEFKARLWQWK